MYASAIHMRLVPFRLINVRHRMHALPVRLHEIAVRMNTVPVRWQVPPVRMIKRPAQWHAWRIRLIERPPGRHASGTPMHALRVHCASTASRCACPRLRTTDRVAHVDHFYRIHL